MRRLAFERWKHQEGRRGEVIILDNRDSFVFNLVHRLYEVCPEANFVVVRSDETSVEELARWEPGAIIISPGPGHPVDAGCSVDVVKTLGGRVPMLGVCLGHQAIVEAMGGVVESSGLPMHGESSIVRHDGRGVFEGCRAEGVEVGRYHALVARSPLPDDLEESAYLDVGDGQRLVMGVRHRRYKVYGVQFHPESVLTVDGRVMLMNFMSMCRV